MPTTDTAIFDRALTLERLGGNAELLEQLIQMFLQRHAALLQAITESLPGRNLDAIRQAVHRLRSPSSNFAASKLAASLERLESMCVRGEVAGLDEAFQSVDADLAELVGVLDAL